MPRAYFADLVGYDCADCHAAAQRLDGSGDGHRSFIAHAAGCPAVSGPTITRSETA